MSVPFHQRNRNNNKGGKGPGGNQKGGGGGGGGGKSRGNNNRNDGGGNQRNNNNNNNNRNNNSHNNNNRGGGGAGDSFGVLKTMLKLVFEKQSAKLYDNNVLHLNNFASIEDLTSVRGSIDFDKKAFCECLCAVIHDFIPDVQFIRLDENRIHSLVFFLDALAKHELHRVVKGISAVRNKINDFGFLPKLVKFRNLVEISLSENPVATSADYRVKISKRLPQLLGIDGAPVQRQPLSLPWPLPSNLQDPLQLNLLQTLEQFMTAVGTDGPDSHAMMYDVNSYCSITMPVDIAFSCASKNNQSQNALASMKQSAKDRNRNLVQVTGNTANKLGRGRSEVCVLLGRCLYPKDFHVLHAIDSNADVQLLSGGDGVKGPMAIITLHGQMLWRHRGQPDTDKPLTLNFDRTFVMIQNQSGEWCITNDMINLRNPLTPAVFMAQHPDRIAMMASKYGLPPDALDPIVQQSSSDAEMVAGAQEISAIGLDALNACAAVVGNDVAKAIVVGRVVARIGCDPSTAVQALSSMNFDLEAATAALAAGN